MSMNKGEVRVLHIKVNGVHIPIGCLTTNGFNESVATLPTATRASNGWRTSIPTTQEFSITFEGIQKLNDTSIVTFNDLKSLKRARTRIEWGLSLSGTIVDEGFGYITELGETAAAGEFISFTGNILGYGEPIVVQVDGDLFQDGSVMLFQDGNAMIFQ